MYEPGCLQRTQQGLTTNPNFCPRKNTRKTDISHFLRIPATNGKIKATAIPKSNQAVVRFFEARRNLSKIKLVGPPEASRPPSLDGPCVHPSCFWQRANLGEEDKEEAEVEALLSFKRIAAPSPVFNSRVPSIRSAAGLRESDLGSHRVDAVISPDGRCGCYRSTHPPAAKPIQSHSGQIGPFRTNFCFRLPKSWRTPIFISGQRERGRAGM